MRNDLNLRALAKFLSELVEPEKFDMQTYIRGYRAGFDRCSQPSDTKPSIHNCGTAACAMGYAPLLFSPIEDESWNDYSERVFGLMAFSNEWSWCFGSDWAYGVDNTPTGAAKRILWLIEHGLPEDHHAQRDGEAELCYQ